MDKQGGLQDGMWMFPKPLFMRRDRATAEIVEKGIALQEACGTRRAAGFLKYEMVGMEVVVRVLLRQGERRSANAPAQARAPALARDWRRRSIPESAVMDRVLYILPY